MTTDTPRDEDILAFSQAIAEEAIQDVPLVSPELSISDLREEYASGSSVFTAKIDALGKDARFHRVRGDGNCFYRAFGYGLMRAESTALIDRLNSAAHRMSMAKLVYEDFLETSIDVAKAKDLLSAYNDPEQSNSVVVLLRFITSDYLKRHADNYIPYLEEGEVLDRWCERWVDPMGAEADHLQINALVNALDVGVDIINLDRTEGSSANVHNVRPDTEHVEQVIKLLYRPGHYDILI